MKEKNDYYNEQQGNKRKGDQWGDQQVPYKKS